jgi:2-polyprenyl-3-methyl-5-hydroxy-6-metoxy-1,4-benzoquinol methylase
MSIGEPAQPSQTSSTAIDDLITRLRTRVEERRANGEYPDGLEDELEAHFRRIVFHRSNAEVSQLQADVDSLDSHMVFTIGTVATDSDIPGGEILHKAMNKAVARTSQTIVDQVQELAIAVRRAIRTLAVAVQDPNTHVHADLIGHIDALAERLNSYERAPVDSDAAVGDLRRRLEALERAEYNRGFKPFFTNSQFEENFRDTAGDDMASKGYDDLAAEIQQEPALDFGCGRGEFMDIMRKRNINCWGIEIDPKLAADAQERGLRVETGDGVQILASQPDESIGAIILLQVIEHLSIQQQIDVIALAYDKLKPGGRIIVETVNPQSLYNYAHAFFIDPTHTRPVHPAYLSFAFEQAGFSEVKWQWRNPPPENDKLELDGDDPDTPYNRNVKRLNTLLFDAMDYALIVTK